MSLINELNMKTGELNTPEELKLSDNEQAVYYDMINHIKTKIAKHDRSVWNTELVNQMYKNPIIVDAVKKYVLGNHIIKPEEFPLEPFTSNEPIQDTEWKPTEKENKEANRYDKLNPSEKRFNVLYDIKNGVLKLDDYPSIFKKLALLVNKSPIDGSFVISTDQPINSELGRLVPKANNFIINGTLRDLADAQNNNELKKIADKVVEEIAINLHDDHPNRKLQALDKSGKLDEIISFYMKKHHYDLFNIPWFKGAIKLLALHYRKEEQREKRGMFEENTVILETVRYKLNAILYTTDL